MEAYMLSISKYSSFTVSSIILLLLSMKFLEYTTAFTLGNETDRASLLAFKTEITEDSLGALASWNNSLHICKWAGVACGLKHQRVTSLNLQGLKLSGTISPHLGNLSFYALLTCLTTTFKVGNLFRLQYLNMSFNFLGGHISANLSQCSNLTALVLDHNYFVGQIPYELGYLVNLRQLYLGNNLTESIPASIGNLAALRVLYLSYNHLQGEVPGSISQLRDLAALGLSDNNLYGEFPPALYNMSSLRFIALMDNKLQHLGAVNFSYNSLTGSIPPDIGDLSNLVYADFSYNRYSGNIPISMGKLSAVTILYMQNNSLQGTIPYFGGPLSLQYLDLSCKNLSGQVPPFFMNLSSLVYLNLSFNNLEGGFSSENLIDSGSFGTVDKGTLSPDETVIAVKVLHLHLPDASKSFMAECQALRHTRHRNLVKVITACSSSDFQGNDFKAIVYPFMTNGSLEEWLHPKSERHHNGLNIIQRINILVDVAAAIS
nr:putative receptor-like protein kinase At3g47110 [Coffea arabica]